MKSNVKLKKVPKNFTFYLVKMSLLQQLTVVLIVLQKI